MTDHKSVYVRARDGAFYLDPLIVFAEGFICFSHYTRPEAVLWDPDVTKSRGALRSILDRVFVYGFEVDTAREAGRSLRVVPGSDPFDFKPAAAFTFEVTARIPVPQLYNGSARYPRLPVKVYDWEASVDDATHLHSS